MIPQKKNNNNNNNFFNKITHETFEKQKQKTTPFFTLPLIDLFRAFVFLWLKRKAFFMKTRRCESHTSQVHKYHGVHMDFFYQQNNNNCVAPKTLNAKLL